MKSLKIVFPEKNAIQVMEEEVTDTLQPDEILCEAQKSLISIGTETWCLRGEADPGTNWHDWLEYPFEPGYSMAAKVMAVGSEVEQLKVGDRVATGTSHKQFFKMRADSAIKIPDEITDEEATWMSLSRVAQLGVRRADMDLGERVGVVGLGAVGQLVVQYLKNMGCRQVICIDLVKSRIEKAKANGATHVIQAGVQTARDEVHSITGGNMLDIVFDVSGHPDVFAPATQLARKLGRVVLLGDTPTPSKQVMGPRIVADSISILGIHGTMFPKQANAFNLWTHYEMTQLFFEFVSQKRMDVQTLNTHHFSPVDAPQVYKTLLQNRDDFLGIIFDWDQMT